MTAVVVRVLAVGWHESGSRADRAVGTVARMDEIDTYDPYGGAEDFDCSELFSDTVGCGEDGGFDGTRT